MVSSVHASLRMIGSAVFARTKTYTQIILRPLQDHCVVYIRTYESLASKLSRAIHTYRAGAFLAPSLWRASGGQGSPKAGQSPEKFCLLYMYKYAVFDIKPITKF